MSSFIGQTLNGRYELLDLIGEGGMAQVYKARHLQLDRLVAVKVMLSHLTRDPNFAQRFEREARLVAQLQHPHIIQVYDYDAIPAERLYYMVVELLSGPSLAERLAAERQAGQTLPLAETLRIVRDVASALDYAHGQGMVHRDIKPGNVMLDDGRVVLTDFGLARVFAAPEAAQLTTSSVIVGTPAYLAPEQALGRPGDARSDLYSLGIMLYQMVTNRLPFQADTPLALALQHVTAPLEPPGRNNPALPGDLEKIILRLTAKKPGERYPNAQALLADLDQLQLAGVPGRQESRRSVPPTLQLPGTPLADPNAPPADAPGPTYHRPLALALLGLMVALLFAGIIFALRAGILFRPVGTLPTLAVLAAAPSSTATASSTPTASWTVTSTLTATLTDTDTASPSPTFTASVTASLTATPSLCSASLVHALPLKLRTGPGDVFPFSNDLIQPGEALPVTGVARDAVNQQAWWQVMSSPRRAWAPDSEVSLEGPCASVPILNVPTPTGTLLTPTRGLTATGLPTATSIPSSTWLPTLPAATSTPPPTLRPTQTERPSHTPTRPFLTNTPTHTPLPTRTPTRLFSTGVVPDPVPIQLPTLGM